MLPTIMDTQLKRNLDNKIETRVIWGLYIRIQYTLRPRVAADKAITWRLDK